MDKFLNPETWRGWAEAAWTWTVSNATDSSTLLQLAVLLAAALAALLLARPLRPLLARALEGLKAPVHLRPLMRAVPNILAPALFVVLLWLVIGVMKEVWPEDGATLLRVPASLMSAWVVIRLGSTFIRNRVVAQALALLAWTVAALNITGLLGPTVEALDALALNFGTLRISLLTVIKGMAMLALFLWAATALSNFLERRIRQVPDLTPSIQVLLGKLLKVTLIAFAVVITLNSIGIDLSALALFSGALGVGLGFGLQKVVSNLISGVIILLDKSVKPGDVIELGDTFGWITSLGARYVSLVTRDGKEYLIPNEDLITQRVVNWSFTDELVRLEISFGVSYGSDPHEVRRLAVEAAGTPERVVDTPAPVCHLTAFGDSSLDFVLRFWIRNPREGITNVRGQVLLALWDTFQEHGIEIPFPHRKILLPEGATVTASAGKAG